MRGLPGVMVLVACSSHPHEVGGADAGADANVEASVDASAVGDAAGARFDDFVFVANYASGISAFEIQADGTLAAVAGAPFDHDVRFYAVALHPSRPILYAAEYTGHAIRAYEIGPDTGVLAPLGDPVVIDHPVVSIAVDPRGRFVYAGDFDDADFTHHSLYTFGIDATGALSPGALSSLARSSSVAAIATDRSGATVYTTGEGPGIRAYSVDAGGTLAELTSSPFATTSVGGGWLAIHPTADIFYTARQALAGFASDATSGALTALAGSPFAGAASADPGAIAVAVDAHGRFACAVDMTAGTLGVYRLAGDGRVEVPGASYDVGTFAYSVAIDPDSRFVYVATDFGNVTAFSVDPTSFALTRLPQSPPVAVGGQPEMVVFRGAQR